MSNDEEEIKKLKPLFAEYEKHIHKECEKNIAATTASYQNQELSIKKMAAVI